MTMDSRNTKRTNLLELIFKPDKSSRTDTTKPVYSSKQYRRVVKEYGVVLDYLQNVICKTKPTKGQDVLYGGECMVMNNTMFCAKQRCIVNMLTEAKFANDDELYQLRQKQMFEQLKFIMHENNYNIELRICKLDKSEQLKMWKLLTYYLQLIDVVNRCIVSEKPQSFHNAINAFLEQITKTRLEIADTGVDTELKETFGLTALDFSNIQVAEVVNHFMKSTYPTTYYEPYVAPTTKGTYSSAVQFITMFNQHLRLFDYEEMLYVPSFNLDDESDTEEASFEYKSGDTTIPDWIIAKPQRFYQIKSEDVSRIFGYGGDEDIREVFGYKKIRVKSRNEHKPDLLIYLTHDLYDSISDGISKKVEPVYLAWTIWLANELDRRVASYFNSNNEEYLKQPKLHLSIESAASFVECGDIDPKLFLSGQPVTEDIYCAGLRKKVFQRNPAMLDVTPSRKRSSLTNIMAPMYEKLKSSPARVMDRLKRM